MNASWWIAFGLSFCGMEWVAWALHKYVMHGFLWSVHEDHHVIDKNKVYQKNDAFAIVFAVPSFLWILIGNLGNIPWMEGMGYGVMLYGAIYFIIHEVAIHRRWKIFNLKGSYVEALRIAHQHHHQIRTQKDGVNFGMLLPPLHYFTLSRGELKKMAPLRRNSNDPA